jgi:hypothetical protein
VNVQTKPPVASVVIAVPTKLQSDPPVGVSGVPPKETVAPDNTLNPDPVTVYVAPIGPCPGVTVIAGVVTVNVPLAV